MAAVKNHAKAGGRKAGVPNKATRELREIAAEFSPEAIETAVKLMRNGKVAAAARLQAVNIILDRAHGKPPQATVLTGPNDGPLEIAEITDDLRARAFIAFAKRHNIPLLADPKET